MISFGGWDPTSSGFGTDPWVRGLQVFDLTRLTWSGNYDVNAAAYVKSDLVSNFYSAK